MRQGAARSRAREQDHEPAWARAVDRGEYDHDDPRPAYREHEEEEAFRRLEEAAEKRRKATPEIDDIASIVRRIVGPDIGVVEQSILSELAIMLFQGEARRARRMRDGAVAMCRTAVKRAHSFARVELVLDSVAQMKVGAVVIVDPAGCREVAEVEDVDDRRSSIRVALEFAHRGVYPIFLGDYAAPFSSVKALLRCVMEPKQLGAGEMGGYRREGEDFVLDVACDRDRDRQKLARLLSGGRSEYDPVTKRRKPGYLPAEIIRAVQSKNGVITGRSKNLNPIELRLDAIGAIQDSGVTPVAFGLLVAADYGEWMTVKRAVGSDFGVPARADGMHQVREQFAATDLAHRLPLVPTKQEDGSTKLEPPSPVSVGKLIGRTRRAIVAAAEQRALIAPRPPDHPRSEGGHA